MRRSVTDLAIVLSRTDYEEKDRILTLLTPEHGKLKAIARSVRSPKSRLAGGIELFAENEVSLAEGRGELYTVTYSRMKRYFGDIAKDIDASMYVYECLKTVNKLTPDHAGGEYYGPLVEMLAALDAKKVPFDQIKIWYGLKMLENLGASPNFKSDSDGIALSDGGKYGYDFDKQCFFGAQDGPYTADHIKLLRHLEKLRRPVEVKGAEQAAGKAEQLIALLLRNYPS